MSHALDERTLSPEQARAVQRIMADPAARCPRPPRAFASVTDHDEQMCLLRDRPATTKETEG